MAVMKLSQKDIRKNNEDKIKLDRSQISYDSAYVSDLEKRHKESVSAMESYRSRISSGGFLSSDDLAAYRKAMDSYIDTSESLNGLSRVFGSGSVDDNQWHNTVASMEKDYKGISDYYSKWKTEADFKVAMEQAKANEQRMAEITSGYDPVKNQQEAQTGWGDYLQTQERIAQSKAQAEEDKSWFEKLAGYLGDIGQDTSLPVHTTQQVSQGYREQETAMKKPDDRWTEEQQQTFGYLWNQDRRKAAEYAQTINNMLNTQQEQEQLRKIQGWATDSFGAGAAHTAGALLTAPLGMADYMGDLIAQGTLGYIPESDGQISPFEYSQMVTGSISQHLNEYGTLNENIPVIGGKGLGDVYGLGTSIAQSALAAYSGGSGQALVQFFGSAAASGVDDALKRGANGDQAIAYGTMSGLAEALAEKLGVDNLLKIGASNTMRQLVMNIVKQGAAEGLEEGATTLMNNFADQLVLQDKSNFYGLVEQYMSQGLAEGDAKTQAWLDMANDLAFDMVAGFASGAIHAGPQTAYNTFMQNDYAKNTYGGFQQELVGEALEIDPDNAYAQKMQGRLDKGKDLSGGQLNEIIRQNTAAITAQDMQSIQTAAETRLTELGETGDVATVAAALTKLYEKEIIPAVAQGLSATVYTQLSDVEEEQNGFVTYDRAVEKIPIAVMATMNDKIYKTMRACTASEEA